MRQNACVLGKLKACLALRLAFCKVPYVLETIVFPIVMAHSNESF